MQSDELGANQNYVTLWLRDLGQTLCSLWVYHLSKAVNNAYYVLPRMVCMGLMWVIMNVKIFTKP